MKVFHARPTSSGPSSPVAPVRPPCSSKVFLLYLVSAYRRAFPPEESTLPSYGVDSAPSAPLLTCQLFFGKDCEAPLYTGVFLSRQRACFVFPNPLPHSYFRMPLTLTRTRGRFPIRFPHRYLFGARLWYIEPPRRCVSLRELL